LYLLFFFFCIALDTELAQAGLLDAFMAQQQQQQQRADFTTNKEVCNFFFLLPPWKNNFS